MSKFYILFNPKAGNGKCKTEVTKLNQILSGKDLEFIDVTTVKDYKAFFAGLNKDDSVVISGGDGTINHFVNDTDGIEFENDVLYYAAGSGNDFLKDVGKTLEDGPFSIKQYLNNLPKVTVNGNTFRFINGVGYGIDGYCCEVGDRLRETTTKAINYAGIAIKGLLFHYKPANAKVTCDGVAKEYKKVWLSPTMFGRFYGGGMMPTPSQDRNSKDHTVSTMIMYGSGKLKTLMVFPSIFKGEHVKKTNMVDVLTGHNIEVEYDKPTSVQIDGETILGVTKVSVNA